MEFLVIGMIVNVHGLKGEVKIYTYTDDIDSLIKLKKIYLEKDGNSTEYIVERASISKGNLIIVKLKGINNANEAEKLRDYIVKRQRSSDEALEDDTYYITDLIDSEVYTIENEYLGKIKDVLQNGAADVYVIKNDKKETLLPAIKKVVKSIDIKGKKVIVEMMEGLE